jgi:prolyl 4-hydroxylase
MPAEYRAQIGPWVAHRLKHTPGVLKRPTNEVDIFVVRDFLTEAECRTIVKQVDLNLAPSNVLGAHPDPDYRTSWSGNVNPHDRRIAAIETKINGLMGIDPAHGETIQGQRYAPGQQFKAHYDFFLPDQPYWEAMEAVGGQRTWTAMVFLREPEAGGHTHFPRANIKVAPRRGNLLCWNNLDGKGDPNYFSMHQGMPVESGVKYVITKWYRERPWTPAPAAT